MKKSKMMRLASCLLVLTLLTTCMISGTFAKYVTEGTSQDTARVAQWGVEVTGKADMFKTEYEEDDSSFTLAANTVVSNNGDKLVAPGTKGALTDVNLTGTPEVAVRVTYDATVDLAGWNLGGAAYYCPLIIKVEDTPIDGLNYTSEADFEAAVKAAIEACKADFEPNTNLASIEVSKTAPTVTWEWPFVGVGTRAQTDAHDTMLGDQAADGNAATVSLTVKTTVTQID